MSTDADSGIEVMRARMERGRRRPPRPRRPAGDDAPTRAESAPAAAEDAPPSAAADATHSAPEHADGARPPSGVGERTTRARTPAVRRQERLSPSLPSANLAIRVRRPLDDRLADAIHGLRGEGVRTSKVELIEMLLWELDASDLAALTRRIARFRRAAPRVAGADELEG